MKEGEELSTQRRSVENKSMLDIMKPQLITGIRYSVVYFIALLYWELLLRTQTGFEDMSWFFLLFIPAEAAFLGTLNGWFRRKGNRIALPVIMLIPFAFYVAQLVYYRIFGSMFSISMIGMGADAMEDFGWALKDTIKDSFWWIILCLVPVFAAIVYAFISPKRNFKKYSPLLNHMYFCSLTIFINI